jgi:CelD/BcsL family acetyltransferase involved in cellulose biosynthesis
MSPGSASALRVQLDPLAHSEALAKDWTELEQRADASFFLGWGWIGTWLDAVLPYARPLVWSVQRGSELVGLALLVEQRARRRLVVASRGAHLHETGDPALDRLTIEHNGLLSARGLEAEVAGAALAFAADALRARRWDELHLPGVSARYEAAARACRAPLLVWKRHGSPWVDLARVRAAGGDPLAIVDGRRRRRARRALRLCAAAGPLRTEPARSRAEALEFLAGLVPLHEARWRGAGAFSSPFLLAFHRELVRRRFDAGEIQLLRFRAGESVLGYAYNFVYRGRVYFYQWGLAPPADPRTSPGIAVQLLAIAHNAARGADVYDMLHGPEPYKRRFATDQDERLWLVLQRARPVFALENALRRARRRLPRLAAGIPGRG